MAAADLLVGAHLGSSLVIGLGCLAIQAALLVLVYRHDARRGPVPAGLAALVLAGAVAHLVHAWTLAGIAAGHGVLLQAAAAAASVALAAGLWLALPRLLAGRSAATLEREVEERRAAEQRALASERRARDSEARMAAFIANLAEALFAVRVERPPGGEGQPRLVIETVNPAFEGLFGVRAADLGGQPAEAVLPAPLRAFALPRWYEAAARGERLDYEITADLPAGRRTWQTVLVPMRGPGGEVERLLGSARDVTATRRLQAGLVESARLATVGSMCAGLAHEASQPLNAAALWLRRTRAAAAALAPEQQAPIARAAAVVEDQLRRAGDLVARIRALAGEEPREAATFDAAGPVAAALRVAATQFADEGIALALQGESEGLMVRGSEARLEQAVLQLLANARDAVQDRRRRDPLAPARIEVVLRREPGRVAVEVRDSGTGIPEPLREAIFAPFFTTKEPGRGTGLGLPFAAGVARAMGGGLEAWSLVGGGACFRMELAAAAGAAPAAAAAAA